MCESFASQQHLAGFSIFVAQHHAHLVTSHAPSLLHGWVYRVPATERGLLLYFARYKEHVDRGGRCEQPQLWRNIRSELRVVSVADRERRNVLLRSTLTRS